MENTKTLPIETVKTITDLGYELIPSEGYGGSWHIKKAGHSFGNFLRRDRVIEFARFIADLALQPGPEAQNLTRRERERRM